jgi:pimeloyl-ACP methyl ester carboxylesterase
MAWQSGDVQVNGLRLHYVRTGTTKPTIVLVHGMTDYGRYWTRVAQALEADFDLVMYDMRGHGSSDVPATGYTPSDYASDLLGLIAALYLDRPIAIGHSLGGLTTLVAAASADAFRAIILEDPACIAQSGPPEMLAAYGENWRTGNAALKQLDQAGRIAQCHTEHPSWIETESEFWAESKALVQPQIFDGFSAMMSYPWRTAAATLHCPALLLTADPALGAVVTPAVAEEFAQSLPDWQISHFSGVGHHPHTEQLDAFVAAVHNFIARLG